MHTLQLASTCILYARADIKATKQTFLPTVFREHVARNNLQRLPGMSGVFELSHHITVIRYLY